MNTSYTLDAARERLQALLEGRAHRSLILREGAPADDKQPLEIKVLRHGDTLIWCSINMRLLPDDAGIEFELELSTDFDLPEGLRVTCEIGASRVDEAAGQSTVIVWRAPLDAVLDKRNKRVGKVKLRLHTDGPVEG
jgi:hypothetical protein